MQCLICSPDSFYELIEATLGDEGAHTHRRVRSIYGVMADRGVVLYESGKCIVNLPQYHDEWESVLETVTR
jgi:uncharacterized protein (DUF169 family)